ncbi:MAG: 2-hydroxyacyl-CoA dehydratase [Desulfobacterales bacterium]|nr:2-hydroxyacyl-CoA dehydratase [Desulfobacterales bacterium]
MAETKSKFKKIKATGTMHKLMAKYFYELDNASKTGEKKIAWCTSVGPAEILRAMGFLVHFPENHGAMLGATRMATDLIPEANAIGYSPDICSYLTADVGAYLKGITPLSKAYKGIERVPKPDVLVFNTNQCRDVQDWFAFYAKEFNVPLIGVHAHVGVGEVKDAQVDDVAAQMKALIPTLEEISGNKFDMDELKRVLGLSRECSELWKKVLDTASAVPSPLTFFDGTIHMGPAVVLRGTQEANDYYNILLPELEERIANKEAAVDGEKHRIYWDGMPVWGRLSVHAKMFSALNTNVLASTYCNSWIFSAFDPDDPFRSMAKAYTELFIVRNDDAKEKYIKSMLEFFKVDGIIYHDAKTCPNNSNCRYGLSQRIEKVTGVPMLTINGDLNDMRLVSDEQTQTNVEAFIEQLEEA